MKILRVADRRKGGWRGMTKPTAAFRNFDAIFIYFNWFSTLWQWLVNLYKNRKETAIYKGRNNTQQNTKHRIHKIENKPTTQEHEHKKNNKKHKSSN